MKRIVLLALALALLGVLAACAPAATPTPPPAATPEVESPTIAAIKEAGKLRAGVAVALPTIGQDPKTGEFFGPAIEVGKWLAEGLGVEVEFVDTNWDTAVAGLQANKYEVCVAGLYATPQRVEVIDFVNYTRMGFCGMVLKDNDKVNTLEDFNKPETVLGIYTGSGHEPLRDEFPNATFDSVVSPPGAETRIEELLAGRIDVAFLDSPLILVYQEEYPQVKVIPESPEYCYENPIMGMEVGISVAKGDPAWYSYVESVVKGRGEEIQQLLKKYSAPEYLRPQE